MAKFQLGILGAFLSWSAYGQSITNISTSATSAQAIIKYTAPNSTRCTTAVSQSSSLSPLFPQTDSTKFVGGLSDASFSFLDSGLNRTIVVGQKAVLRGTVDNIPYSLNLGAGQLYFFQISCGATTSTISSFTTRLANLGLSYVDPIQADPQNPGENLNPWVDLSQRNWIVDPQTGYQIEPVTLPHDVTQCGAVCSSLAITNANVSMIGSGWIGSNFPYAITNNNTGYLAFSAYGMHFFPPYPWGNLSSSYASDNMTNLNWAQWVLTLSSSGSGDVMQACISENGVSCDPWGNIITCNVPTTSGTCTFGTGTTQYQGGWISAGHRFRNGPETNPRTGNAICSGTNVTLDQYVNHLWSNGTPIVINGSNYTITALTGDYTLTINASCTSGSYVAQSLWWLFKMQNSTAHTIAVTGASSTWEGGLGAEYPPGAFWGVNSYQSVTGVNGAPGYLVSAPTGLGLYWINATTGAVSLLGDTNLLGGNLCDSNSATWDTRPGVAILYCNQTGGSGIVALTYTPTDWTGGTNFDQNSPNQFCGTVAPPCWTVSTITPSIDNLTAAFNSQYTTLGIDKGMTAAYVVGNNAHNDILLRSWANNGGSLGWLILFNPVVTSNGQPGNAGCMSVSSPGAPGCVVAAIPTFAAEGANNQSLRGSPLKGSVLNNAGFGIINMGPYFYGNTNTNGEGPLQIGTTGGFAFTTASGGVGGTTTCPSNPFVSGSVCTAVPVDGQPYDPNPGPNETGARGEYLTVQPGDYLGVANCSGIGCADYIGLNSYEMVRVVVANMSTGTCGSYPAPCIWVQRAATRDTLYCGTGGGASGWPNCGFGAAKQSSPANVLLQYTVSQAAVFWNYISDPMGTGLLQEYPFASGGHQTQFNGIGIDCCSSQVSFANNACQDASGQCYGVKTDPGLNTWNLITRTTPVFDASALQNPPFNGISVPIGGSCSGGGCGNSTAIHPSTPGGIIGATTYTDRQRYSQDSRPFGGFWNTPPCTATNVTGTLWKYAAGCIAGGGTLHRKVFPTHASWGIHPLLDISPTVISGTSADSMKYCVPVNSGDCYGGSIAGEAYFNVPWLTYRYSYFQCQSCPVPDVASVTIVDSSPQLDALVEFPITDPSDRGTNSRVLTRGFSPTGATFPFMESQALPNNYFDITRIRSFLSTENTILLIKRTQEIQDSIARTQYSQPSISIPSSPGYAKIRWGYLENGTNGTTQFDCTTRLDECDSTSSPSSSVPYLFGSESQSPTSCASGCSIVPSWIPDRVLLYQIGRTTDSTGKNMIWGPTQTTAIQ